MSWCGTYMTAPPFRPLTLGLLLFQIGFESLAFLFQSLDLFLKLFLSMADHHADAATH